MTNTIANRMAALLCALLLASVAAHAEEAGHNWNFKVFLDDKPVGYHHFSLQQHGNRRELTSSARFNVKVLFMNAYTYVHDASEQWQGDCLQSMQASTNDNGKSFSVTAQHAAAELKVRGSPQPYSIPGCAMSFAYWNTVMLKQAQLLNAQTGEYDRVTIKSLGDQSLKVRGQTQLARHYRLTGNKLSIELWYSQSDEWLALESSTDSGKRLRYLLD